MTAGNSGACLCLSFLICKMGIIVSSMGEVVKHREEVFFVFVFFNSVTPLEEKKV